MQLVNLIRAHVLGHSTAAMALGKWDLARVISLKKFDQLNERQVSLLQKVNRVNEKLRQGGIFTWYYRHKLERLTKEFSSIGSKLEAYHIRAIKAQSHIEPGIDHSKLNVQVQCRSKLSPELMRFDYSNTPQCLIDASLIANKLPILIHRQTLHTTADMASAIIDRLDGLVQARYLLIRTTENLEISEEQLRQVDEIALFLQESINFHLASMHYLADNVAVLTSNYNQQQHCQRESGLIQNISASLAQFLALYGQNDTKFVASSKASTSDALLAKTTKHQLTDVTKKYLSRVHKRLEDINTRKSDRKLEVKLIGERPDQTTDEYIKSMCSLFGKKKDSSVASSSKAPQCINVLLDSEKETINRIISDIDRIKLR